MRAPAPRSRRPASASSAAIPGASSVCDDKGAPDLGDVGEVAEARDRVLGLDEASDDLDRVTVAAHRADLPGLGGGVLAVPAAAAPAASDPLRPAASGG